MDGKSFWKRFLELKLFGVTWWYWIYPMKWGIFLKGTYTASQVPFEFCEIVVYRSIMCRECLEKGSCVNCGCKSPDNFMVLENWCSAGNWNQTTIDQWNEYKERTGLKFEIEYK